MLSIINHDRDSTGARYVYPVISRRAGGVSVGINLNVNRACNWACVYCQVDGLSRGGPPPVDLPLLREELRVFLIRVLTGNFLESQVPEDYRRLMDVAFSGDGEPTAAPHFAGAVDAVCTVLSENNLAGKLPLRLITNGSLLHRKNVQTGIVKLALFNGEVWFKIDRADESMQAVNGVPFDVKSIRRHLSICCDLAPTWIQSCYFAFDGIAPDEHSKKAYLDLLRPFAQKIKGIHLYGVARAAMQPESHRVSALPQSVLEDWAARLKDELGVPVQISL